MMKNWIKKLLLGVLFLSFAAQPAFAAAITACTITMEKSNAWGIQGQRWQAVYRIKAVISVPATDPDEFNLSTYDTNSVLADVRGGCLYKVHIGPGTDTPDTDAVTITLDGELGEDWLSFTTTTLTSKVEEFDGESKVIWTDIQIDLPDIGSAGDDIIMYFTVFR